MKELNILHISDIHLGTKEKAELYFERLEEDLTKGLHITKLDFLVISGDIANQATSEDYDAALVLVKNIIDCFGIDLDQVVIVPGNHDINWSHSRGAYTFIFRNDFAPSISEAECIPAGEMGVLQRNEEEHKQRFANFACFYKRIYGYEYPREYEKQGIIYPCEKHRILFLGLNTAWEIDHHFKEPLSINLKALSNSLDIISEVKYEGWVKCVVFHHPVSGPDMIKNIDFIEELASHGVHILLHGHIHRSIEGCCTYDDEHRVYIIRAGVFGGITRDCMITGNPFQYNLLRYDRTKHTISVESREKEKEEGGWSAGPRWVDEDNQQQGYLIDLGVKTAEPDFKTGDSGIKTGPRLKARADKAPPRFSASSQNIQGIVQAGHIENITQYFTTTAQNDIATLTGKALRLRYLSELASDTNHLPWASLDPDYANPEYGEALRLTDIYTAMDTTEIERMETEDDVRKHLFSQEDARRISAQEMINTHTKLVLLGDPGSGKSTLVNFLTYIMAEAGIGDDSKKWLDRLKRTGPWDHGVLFPVRVLLRYFASGLSSTVKKGNSDLLLSTLKAALDAKGLLEFWAEFHKGLLTQDTPYLILLDGLDEVPVSLREIVVETIDDFVRKYEHHRYLITCRLYAYIGRCYHFQGFKQATLTPFNQQQIESFISAWYHELYIRKRFTLKDAHERANRLKQVALQHDLKGLAERPLLMTVMALLHTFRGQLPDDRVELYKQTVDLLLRRWEGRFGKEKGLIEILNIPGLKMNDLEAGLYDVAFYVHSGHGGREETADIESGILRERLAPYLNNDYNKAEEFIEYVRERAGLLIRHKISAYTFPHRTFQEFMAACHLVVGKEDYPGEAARLVKQDPERWRIVFILAAGYAARNLRLSQAIAAVNALCPLSLQEAGEADKVAFNRAEIAAEALLEIGLVGVKRDQCGKVVLMRVKNWLMAAMEADKLLKSTERIVSGNLLGKIGDPRFNPEYWYLPDDPCLGFIEIPAGPFMMGSDKREDKDAFDSECPQHEVTLSHYEMGRYPVTEAQFRVFIKESGYDAGDEWERGLESHPVVNVSWYDAKAYCEWLTEKLKDRGWVIRLPTEAEWEKAARGTDRRIYPWGNKPDPDKSNYDETNIGITSPVGSFPGGASPYGILDMSGNVLEWCLDRYGDYPSHSMSDSKGLSEDMDRVSRGGAWIFVVENCRAAYRNFNHPGNRYGFLGFRLAKSLA